MSVIGEFTVPSESFLLGETLREVPEMVVELQRVVAHSYEKLVPFFWVQHGDKERFDDLIRDDATVTDVVLLDDFEGGRSYRATWTENAKGVAYAYIKAGATILEATGQDDTWTLRLRFDDDEAVAKFNRYCQKKSIPFTLNRLYHPSQPMSGGQYGLTPLQRETLIAAFRAGYYQIPRTVDMGELATELNTSQQNLSKRFRKAYSALIENVLIISDEGSMSSEEIESK